MAGFIKLDLDSDNMVTLTTEGLTYGEAFQLLELGIEQIRQSAEAQAAAGAPTEE